ncbi:MAG: MATE family efflux transporter [Eubacteriales bacterium]|nr:MATE family efflux transporter [Eubacteriales bacterium]
MTKNLTEGKPMGLIIRFAFPVLLAMLFQQFYNLVDTMIVGKFLGSEALAAVGSTGSLNFMVIGFCIGICSGFAIPMAQSFGAGDENELKRYIGNAFWLCVVTSIVMAIATGLLCRTILVIMRTPEDIIDTSYSYIHIIFWGIPVTYLYNMLSSMIRSVGDSKTPVIFLGLSSVLNIILDIVLITIVKMGVSGAAVATVTAQAISGLLCLAYLKKKFPILQPSKEQWHFRRRYAGKLCMIGIPMGLQYSITAIGSIILQTAVNSLGTLYVASVTAGTKLHMFFGCVFDALGSTSATYTGQNIGAKKADRVQEGIRDCMILGSIYAVFALAVFFFFSNPLISLFANATDPNYRRILANARLLLLWNGAFYIPLAGVNIYRFCIQGMGYSQTAIISGALEMAARAFVGLALIPRFGYVAAVTASPIAWIAANSFLIPAYYHYLRKQKRILGYDG